MVRLLILRILAVLIISVQYIRSYKLQGCVDKVHNLIVSSSDTAKHLPATILDFKGAVYNEEMRPSCFDGKPNLNILGYIKFLDGKLVVNKKYDLIKSGDLLMTVKGSSFDEPLCVDGKSNFILVPDSNCKLRICDFLGIEMCKILQEPGVHTIDELEEKVGFNTTQKLWDPSNGVFDVSLLDFLGGQFLFHYKLVSDGETILELTTPTNDKFLQVGVKNF